MKVIQDGLFPSCFSLPPLTTKATKTAASCTSYLVLRTFFDSLKVKAGSDCKNLQLRGSWFCRDTGFRQFPCLVTWIRNNPDNTFSGFLVMTIKRAQGLISSRKQGREFLIKLYTNESTNRERIRFIQPGIRFY